MNKKLVPYLAALTAAFDSEFNYSLPIPKPTYRKTGVGAKKCKSCKFFKKSTISFSYCAKSASKCLSPLHSACEQYQKRK